MKFRRLTDPRALWRIARWQARLYTAVAAVFLLFAGWAWRRGNVGGEVLGLVLAGVYLVMVGLLVWRMRRLKTQPRSVDLFAASSR